MVTANAQTLSRKESRPVCRKPDACIDLVQRHAPDSFDYAELARAISDLGPRGEVVLMALADDPKTASRAFALARQDAIALPQRRALIRAWPSPDPALHIRMGQSVRDHMFIEAALKTLSDPKLRGASLALIATQSAEQVNPIFLVNPGVVSALSRDLAASPSLAVVQLLAQVPGERTAPVLRRALDAPDADIITSAYLALESRSDTAPAALEDAFRRAPATAMPAWTTALERIGMQSQGFDTIAFGYRSLRDDTLPPSHRAVGLHSALLYPVGEKGRVTGGTDLIPLLVELPISDRLATTAPTHPLFSNIRTLRPLLEVWQGRDTEAVADFARAIGKARPPGAPSILRDMFSRTPDYRVQLASIVALTNSRGQDLAQDLAWLAPIARSHPVTAVRSAAATATDKPTPKPRAACRAQGTVRETRATRLPFFQSGRDASGASLPRFRLTDAAPVPGGWLAAYDDTVLRYGSDDTAALLPGVVGTPVALLPDTKAARPAAHWLLTRGDKVARLYRYTDGQGLAAPLTLPRSARPVKLDTAKGWALAFDAPQDAPRDTPQDTLVIRPNGALTTLCDAKPG